VTEDQTVKDPSSSVRRAALTLSQEDSTDATCYGWVPQARRALVAAVNPAPIQGTIEAHGRLTPETEDGPEEDGSVILDDDTPWLCGTCNEFVGTGKDFEVIVATHQAHMVRLLIVGAP
jgi:hypothetical protein